MKTRHQFISSKKAMLAAGTIISALVGVSQGATTISWSTDQPTVDSDDIYSFVGNGGDDGSNVGNGDDQYTYIAGDRPWQGQSFTTGSNNGDGWSLASVSLQVADDQFTWANVDTGWNTNGLYVQVGTLSNGQFTRIADETLGTLEASPQTNIGNKGPGATDGVHGYFYTITLDSPIQLADDTEYAFIVASNGSWHPIDGTKADSYAGGEAITVSKGSFAVENNGTGGDRVFALDISAVQGVSAIPEPSGVLALGLLFGASMLTRRR